MRALEVPAGESTLFNGIERLNLVFTDGRFDAAASDPLARESQANHLVLWRAIERYAKDGFHRLDFGRTSRNNDGLRRFKLAWRPTEYDLDYTRYDFRREGFVAGGNERTTGWHTRVFRLLPPFVSRLIGAIAYKHMA